MLKEQIELVGSTEVAEDVEKKIRNVGVRGLNIQAAVELGVYDRIAKLLCVSHSAIVAAYRVYGAADYLIEQMEGRKNIIAKEMGNFEKAYDRFISFWSTRYANADSRMEMNEESESLFRLLMHWAGIPIKWELGDAQYTDTDEDVAIKINQKGERDLFLLKTIANCKPLSSPVESWCVTRVDKQTDKQTVINADMDRASALMVAKRASVDDPNGIYTASVVRDIEEKRTEVVPFKAFASGETVGKIRKIIK